MVEQNLLTNHRGYSGKIIKYYNQRGAKERTFDQVDNDFGWKHLPKSFMNENAVFLLITAMCCNFYKFIVAQDFMSKDFGIQKNARMKQFVFRFISVPAKWLVRALQNVLVLYWRYLQVRETRTKSKYIFMS